MLFNVYNLERSGFVHIVYEMIEMLWGKNTILEYNHILFPSFPSVYLSIVAVNTYGIAYGP